MPPARPNHVRRKSVAQTRDLNRQSYFHAVSQCGLFRIVEVRSIGSDDIVPFVLSDEQTQGSDALRRVRKRNSTQTRKHRVPTDRFVSGMQSR
jgi:hypothetical protein